MDFYSAEDWVGRWEPGEMKAPQSLSYAHRCPPALGSEELLTYKPGIHWWVSVIPLL